MLQTVSRARTMRRTITEAETLLWRRLRNQQVEGLKFRRQHPVGRYIADFACEELRLIIEADGSQHAENAYDERRTEWLEENGWTVLRFWNNEVTGNMDGVLQAILCVRDPAPHPSTLRVSDLSRWER